MPTTLILTSAIKPSHNTPFLKHVDENSRLKETLVSLKKWTKIIKQYNFNCVLVDNTFNDADLRSKIPFAKFPEVQILAAPPTDEHDLKKGTGFPELMSLKFAVNELGLADDVLIIKSNARYFIRNFSNLFNYVEKLIDVYFYTYLRIDRAETKFFIITVQHLKKFIEFAEFRVNVQDNIHLEHLFADYISSNAYHASISFPIEPVISGISGTTGDKYRFFNESWAHNQLSVIFRKLRK
jgi:hypothetical protein